MLGVGLTLILGLSLVIFGIVAFRFDGDQNVMGSLYIRDMALLASPIFFGNTLTCIQVMTCRGDLHPQRPTPKPEK